MSFLTRCLIAGLLVSQGHAASASATISVHVRDESGKPIDGATVWMEEQGLGIQVNAIPSCVTDSAGNCSYEHFDPGKYRVSAKKESVGYPNLAFPLYGHDKKLPIVELTGSESKAQVSLTLGPKAGVLIAVVSDAVSGVPVNKVLVTMRLASYPKNDLQTSLDSDSSILVPPNEPVLIEIQADGYTPWTLPGQQHIRLHSGEIKHIQVSLQPK
jgi:hypothetical protein